MENKTEWRPGPTVCRCCLAEGCYKDISTEYFWMGKREVYAEMLADTLDLTIGYSSSAGPYSNSRLICEPCITRLRDACDFKRQVQECEKTFMQQLNPENIPSVDVVVQPLETTVKVEAVKSEVPVSDDDGLSDVDFGVATADDDDDDDDDEYNEPLTKLASKVPKKEKDMVDLIDLADNRKATEKRKSSAKSKASPAKKAKTAAKVNEPVASASTASASKVEKKKKAGPSVDPVRRNAELILKYTTAHPFRVNVNAILCVFCLDKFEDADAFRRHMLADHQKFSMLMAFAKIQKSELVKIDYTDLKCKVCRQEFSDLNKIGHHLKSKHRKGIDTRTHLGVMPFLLDKELSCAVCKKCFRSLLLLNKHTASHFTPFICDVCGKRYVTRTGLIQHVRNNHAVECRSLCRHCNRSFSSFEAKKLHQKSEKACMRYSCPDCPERFVAWASKEKHMVKVHGCPKSTYKCVECDVVYNDRLAYYYHNKSVHAQVRYPCVPCGVNYFTKQRLNSHLSKHHSDDKV